MADPESPAGPRILDIMPLIRLRQKQACTHPSCEVATDEAEILCVMCGAPLNPWDVLRDLADHHEQWKAKEAELQAVIAKQLAEHDAWIARANTDRKRLHDEIAHLTDVKNRLGNEDIAGERLVNIARRKRRGPKK